MADEIFEALWHDAEARWARLTEVLDWGPDYRIRGAEVEWVARDEYAHFAHWLEYACAHARARFEGTAPPATVADEDEQNALWAAEDRALTHEQARERCASARQAYIDLINGLPAERRTERVAAVVRGGLVGHFDTHWSYMVAGMAADESSKWEHVTRVLDAQPTGMLHTGDDGRVWTAADIYAHLERWMVVNLPRAEAGLATGVVPELPDSTEALNDLWLAEDAGVSFTHARRRAFVARDAFMAQMRAIPVEAWTARLVSLYGGNAWGHYHEHLKYMGIE
ncbi:MAG: hypothetical protein O2798_07505 [Chloroflexi bacterium]|nr:hypothetical protein [Chloroflexota bacterium]MDA1240674.1 hypothetical protein [Chloroflexota bacterium]